MVSEKQLAKVLADCDHYNWEWRENVGNSRESFQYRCLYDSCRRLDWFSRKTAAVRHSQTKHGLGPPGAPPLPPAVAGPPVPQAVAAQPGAASKDYFVLCKGLQCSEQ